MTRLAGATPDVALWADRVARARRLFFDEGTAPHGLVPDPVLRSWQRCTEVGYKVGEAMAFNPVQRHAVTALQERSRALMLAAAPECQRLEGLLGSAGYGLLLTDAQGYAVAVHGPVARCGPLLRRALRPGVHLSEGAIGTNAMAAAMLEEQAVGIFGHEHYFAQNEQFQCVAAPIFGADGRLHGAIDITRDTPLPQFGMLSLMRDSAAAIEAALFRAVPATLHVSLHWRALHLPASGAIPMLAFGADGEVLAANRHARRFLDLRDDIAGLHHDDLFLGRFDDLRAALQRTPSSAWTLRSGLSLFIGAAQDSTPASVTSRTIQPAPRPLAAFPEFGDDGITLALPRAVRALEAGLPVLILGESGSGKEIAAQALHSHSRLHAGPFIAINCGAIPHELIEGELFGYADGAFTGARRGGAKGRLEQAHGGTLLLDEIGDMPLALQTRLLRVLETRSVTRLGEATPRPLDFQLLSATHQPLDRLVEEGRFRADLLFRLDGLRLPLAPLRQRNRLAALIDVLLAEEGLTPAQLTPACRQALAGYHWPGNCRQLRSALKLACVMAEPGAPIDIGHLPPTLWQPAATAPDAPGSLKACNEALLAATLEELNGNVSATAQRLGVNRSTIHRWQKKAR